MIEPIPDEPIPESVLAKNPRALTYEQFYRMRNGHKTRSAQAQRRYIDSKLNALQAAYAFWELENVRHILRLLVRFDGQAHAVSTALQQIAQAEEGGIRGTAPFTLPVSGPAPAASWDGEFHPPYRQGASALLEVLVR